ncbi:MAG: multidrug effflux MFS transporter, partial [Actinomycetia bacterium]|nr:multidrug effflux MFS transporter [Actinomycetes bacterium]
ARLAGTASAAMGLATMGGGAILAALIDRRIDDSVTPMAVGILGYGCVAFVIAGWARRGSLAPVDPDA